MRRVAGPDGTIIEFPDGTPDETVRRVMRKRFGSTPPENARERAEAGKARGVSPEAQERQREINKQTGIEYRPNMAETVLYNVGQGMSFGTADEIGAAGAALFDEGNFSDAYGRRLNQQRQALDNSREDYPVTATASEVAGALPMAAAAPWAAAGAKGPMLARMLASGAVAGAEGAAYGFASGEGGAADRATNAAIAGGFSVPFGALGPPIASAVGKGAERVLSRKASRAAGVSPEAYGPLANRARTGVDPSVLYDDTAMLVDTSPAFAGLLDTAIQKSGPAGARATQAVGDRVSESTRRVQQALDDTLGIPGQSTSRAVVPYGQSNPLRGLYQRAYSQPIDYTSRAGMEIEDMVRGRVPAKAIAAAKELMRLDGVESKQMMARILDDGTVEFERLPDVMELDYITRGLNQVAESSDGQGALGGKTPLGSASGNLAREIRQRLRDLVPEYGNAVDAARTIIKSGKAREAGETALRSSVTRSELSETIKGMSDSEKLKVREGMRMFIDDVLANVRRTRGDSDVQARQAAKAIMDLSSDAARQKIEMVVGKDAAAGLFRKIDSAARAFNLNADVATNSRTFGRGVTHDEIVESVTGGPVNALRQGKPVATTQELTARLLGRSAEDIQGLTDEAYSDIVAALLQRGPQARATLNQLQQGPQRVTIPASQVSPLVRRLLSGTGVAASSPLATAIQR